MPGAVIHIDKLSHCATARNDKVRRYAQAPQGFKRGIGVAIQSARKQGFDISVAIYAFGQANAVNHKQIRAHALGAQIKMRGHNLLVVL